MKNILASSISFKLVLILLLILTFTKSTSNSTEIYGPLTSEDYKTLYKNFEGITQFFELKQITENKFLQLEDHKDELLCKGCLFIFGHIHNFIKKTYGKIGLFELLIFICDKFTGLSSTACDGYVNKYGHVMADSFLDHYLNGEFICTKTAMCENKHFIKLEADEYARNLLADKPSNNKQNSLNNQYSKILKILHITDIHTDLKYQEGSIGNCKDPFCCRSDSVPEKNTPIQKSGKWGYLGKCDLPLITLLNFVDMVSTQIKPDIIFWTGDNPSHAEWESDTKEEIIKISTLFTNLLKDKFKYASIYPSIGNHEKFPSDQFYPFDSIQENPLLTTFSDLWKDWLGEEAYQEFKKFGYYSKKHLDTNLRIISYNCFYCDVLNFYLIKNPTDPNGQFEWLETTLRMAEKNNEVVYIIGHIPAADTSLLTECAKRFNALTDRFSHIILGQFAGHTHFDEVKVLKEYFNPSKVSGLVYIAPSLTTSAYLNPSFRVFEVDSETKVVKDYIQYRMNITDANENDNPKWEINYRASQHYNITDLTDYEGVDRFVQNILIDNDIYNRSCRAFFADGPQVDLYKDKSSTRKYIYCRYHENTFDDFFDCIGHRTWNTEDYMFKVFNVLTGSWYKKVIHEIHKK